MAPTVLPFEVDSTKVEEDHGDLKQCGLYQILPKEGKEQVTENPHVLQYLHLVPLDTVGTPKFYKELSRDLKKVKNPNLVYPVSPDISVHICPDKNDSRNYYIPIEPVLFGDINALVAEVEKKIAVLVDSYDAPKDAEAKTSILLKCIDEVCAIKTGKNSENGGNDNNKWQDKLGSFIPKFLNGNGTGKGGNNGEDESYSSTKKLYVTPAELKGIKYIMVRDKVGMGVLEPLIRDPYIEDISCSGLGRIFIEHKIFESLKSAILKRKRI
jgi:flagellar protein FlaI